jgi:hypothetical protein
MDEYQVDGTVRKEKCDKNLPITHLTLVKLGKVWESEKIIGMIERKEAKFWSYHYKNGEIDDKTKIEVEVVSDPDGKYLRTRKDETEKNNLLELPIYYKKESGKYRSCRANETFKVFVGYESQKILD